MHKHYPKDIRRESNEQEWQRKRPPVYFKGERKG